MKENIKSPFIFQKQNSEADLNHFTPHVNRIWVYQKILGYLKPEDVGKWNLLYSIICGSNDFFKRINLVTSNI